MPANRQVKQQLDAAGHTQLLECPEESGFETTIQGRIHSHSGLGRSTVGDRL
ncbi:MAG: hypothetical protein ABSG84_14935 [Acidobacteriaceae bacterium]